MRTRKWNAISLWCNSNSPWWRHSSNFVFRIWRSTCMPMQPHLLPSRSLKTTNVASQWLARICHLFKWRILGLMTWKNYPTWFSQLVVLKLSKSLTLSKNTSTRCNSISQLNVSTSATKILTTGWPSSSNTSSRSSNQATTCPPWAWISLLSRRWLMQWIANAGIRSRTQLGPTRILMMRKYLRLRGRRMPRWMIGRTMCQKVAVIPSVCEGC